MKILVVGDVIIDKYSHGRKLGVSAETPTIVAEYDRKDMFVGGAGLVVRNLLRLGCDVTLLTVTGPGESIDKLLIESTDPPLPEELHRFHHNPFVMEGWCLTRKHRYFVDEYKLLQYDVLNKGLWTVESEKTFAAAYEKLVEQNDSVVFCDNRHGVFNKNLAGAMVHMTGKRTSFVDCQVSQRGSSHNWFKTASCFVLNEKELTAVAGDRPRTNDQRAADISAAEDILEGEIVLKCGARGAETTAGMFPPTNVKVVDTCGAGDAFLAALVAKRDIMAANRWAALSTTYKGTIVPRTEDEDALPR